MNARRRAGRVVGDDLRAQADATEPCGLGQVWADIDTDDVVLARHQATTAPRCRRGTGGRVMCQYGSCGRRRRRPGLHQLFGTGRLAVRPPQRHLHQPRLHQLPAVEERRDLVSVRSTSGEVASGTRRPPGLQCPAGESRRSRATGRDSYPPAARRVTWRRSGPGSPRP